MIVRMAIVVAYNVGVLFTIFIMPAQADVTITMNGWDVLPRVQISQGNSGACTVNPIIFDGMITKNYSWGFPNTGAGSANICFRRTRDPQNPASPLDRNWSRCPTEGVCDIP
jgi:hypothetical protein